MTASDNATIKVNLQGTMGFPNTVEAKAGIIPWYVDDNNYVLIYLQWSPDQRTSDLHQIQMTGKVNGAYLPIWVNNTWNTTIEFNSMWTDGIAIAANNFITLSVTKTITMGGVANANGDTMTFSITATNVDGVSVTRTSSFGIKTNGTLPSGKVGLWSQNDAFTFSNLSKTLL